MGPDVHHHRIGEAMLLRFAASNHRSIHEPIELSMMAVDEDREAARFNRSVNGSILTVAGIYGANASGKSNVLDAVAWLSSAVAVSLRAWEDRIPVDPFRFQGGNSLPSDYSIDMIVNDIRFEYLVSVTETEVAFEALYSYPKKQRRTLFEREGESLHLRRGLGELSGTRELLTSTTLALSAAARLDTTGEVRPFSRALSSIGVLGQRPRFRSRRAYLRPGALIPVGSYGNSTQRIFTDLVREGSSLFTDQHRKEAITMLRFADLGIDGVEVVTEDEERGRFPTVRLIHKAGEESASFDIGEESEGTQTWFRLIGPVLQGLRRGSPMLFDEIDASLHPKLSARLIELFQDPETNPLGAQLIFTTHDTSLLNHLNRDEVWLTEKFKGGATRLTALAEFGGDKVRRSLNLERAYLQGRFGAVPEIDQSRLRNALAHGRTGGVHIDSEIDSELEVGLNARSQKLAASNLWLQDLGDFDE